MRTEDKIKKLAAKFKNAILQMKADDFPDSEWFIDFPRGCCGDTCDLLSKYLRQNGIETEYVSAKNGQQWHAWLEYQHLIIDITANQFPGVNEELLITQDKSWHKRFIVIKRCTSDFEKYNSYNRLRLSKIYENMLRKIPVV